MKIWFCWFLFSLLELGESKENIKPTPPATVHLQKPISVARNSTVTPIPLRRSAFGVNSVITVVGGRTEQFTMSYYVYQYFFNTSTWVQVPLLFPFYGPCYSQWKSSDGASSSALYLYSDIHPRQLAVVSMTGLLNVTLLTSADLALADQSLTVPSQQSCALTRPNSSKHYQFYMFGGTNVDESCSNIVIYYNASNDGWKVMQISQSSALPSPRFGASFVNIDNNNIFMLGGGCKDLMAPMKVWRLDTVKKMWNVDVLANPSDPVPLPRTGHSAILDVTSRPFSIMIYGGTGTDFIGQKKDLDDVWRYDLDAHTWTQIVPLSNQTWPAARAFQATTSIPGSMIIFGGDNSSGKENNELWLLALNQDCFQYLTCRDCAIVTGCGWCELNDPGFRCISGMYKHPFTRHACVDEKKFIADYANCNPEPLPWIVALITVAVTMTIGFATLYLALKNDPAEHH